MLKAVQEKIDRSRRILVTAHASPDGDALASTLALSLALREQGKEVDAFNQDGVPEPFAFLPGSETVLDTLPAGAGYDLGVVLDAGELRRVGPDLRPLCRDLVNIDHHPYSESFGSVNWVDVEACATGALIYRLLREAGRPISLPVATCIYAAILSDTGSFRYSNANAEAFAMAGDLIDLGVNPWAVASGLYENQAAERLQLLARCLATLYLSDCGRFASVTVTREMFAATGTGAEHTDGFVNYPRSIRGVEVAVFFRQLDQGSYKVGFRSKGKVDVGALARSFGGGGHHNAAGVNLEGSLESVRELVFRRLRDLLP